MSEQVYITKTASFFPNDPVGNDQMEDYLGLINEKASRSKAIVLRNNGIKQRYYALEKGGKYTHTNAEMTALAVRGLFNGNGTSLENIDLLTCGTSTPDQLMPSHGVMVHGCLPETGIIEVISPAGNCCSGMHAMKYAYLAIKTGSAKAAVTAGSERTSGILKSEFFELEARKLAELEENPYIAFEKEFLRFMLSDGAGAFLMSNQPHEDSTNLRIEWMDSISFAHKIEPCMYQASDKNEQGELVSYKDFNGNELMERSIFSIKQDLKLLSTNVVSLGFNYMVDLLVQKGIVADEIDYFLPHMSSEFFRSKIADHMKEREYEIPQEKWFTNLTSKGNIGAASIYSMIHDLIETGKLETGKKILVAVPESARFSYVYALLTVC